MIKHFRIFIWLMLASVVGLLILQIWIHHKPPEPVYEGRGLRDWLDHHVATSSAKPPFNSPGWKKADEALRRIGTNAIPTLLSMISAKDLPPLLLRLRDIARRNALFRSDYRYAIDLQEEAEYAFQALGKTASNAVPELIRIYEQNISQSSQRCAALSLGHIGRAAHSALPVLIRHFRHTNDEVRFYAVSAVIHIGEEPAVMIPALTGMLKDSSVNVRWNALSGLINFGARARPVIPEIQKMLNDPGMVGDTSITQQVVTALWRIAPEKAGKNLVVEENTPIIANGVTTEAIKSILFGKRQTLIPAGKTVPASGQYWHSDPRPKLTLYRGSSGTEAGDHYLGDFEVLDIPSSEKVNISTLCIVAEGQIVLCARDNNRRILLEIRRVDSKATK